MCQDNGICDGEVLRHPQSVLTTVDNQWVCGEVMTAFESREACTTARYIGDYIFEMNDTNWTKHEGCMYALLVQGSVLVCWDRWKVEQTLDEWK